ncbi:GOLGA6L7P isoform 2 [Pan troglodytes]|uniref:GOLGA6L7P isoform 2 n=1 Tax=Pan troglodytes TaxID=9598 RepID=A0A2J8KLQ4_PANTR|nr:GOLGA6L7P isoform 2 [Pan troglodytes]
MMSEKTQQRKLAGTKEKFPDYHQWNSAGVGTGATDTKKKKINNGTNPETTTSGGCHSPEDKQQNRAQLKEENKASHQHQQALRRQLEAQDHTIRILMCQKTELETALHYSQDIARKFEEDSKDLAGRLHHSWHFAGELQRALSAEHERADRYIEELTKEREAMSLELFRNIITNEELKEKNAELQEKLRLVETEKSEIQLHIKELKRKLETDKIPLPQVSGCSPRGSNQHFAGEDVEAGGGATGSGEATEAQGDVETGAEAAGPGEGAAGAADAGAEAADAGAGGADAEREEQMREREEQMREREEQMREREEQMREREEQMREREEQMRKREEQMGKREEQMREWEEQMEREEQMGEQEEQMGEQEEQMRKREEQMGEQEEQMGEQEEQIRKQEEQMGEQEEQMRKQEEQMGEQEEQMRKQEEQMGEQGSRWGSRRSR